MEVVDIDALGPAPCAVLIIGIPAAGKTTTAGLLAQRFPRGAHVSGDPFAHLIVSGKRLPHPDGDPENTGEPNRQLLLKARNVALVADSFHRAGFVPVIDEVVVRRVHLDFYRHILMARPLVVIVLAPTPEAVLARDRGRAKRGIGQQWVFLDEVLRDEPAGEGHWIDSSDQKPDETVDEIVRHLDRDWRLPVGAAPVGPAGPAPGGDGPSGYSL